VINNNSNVPFNLENLRVHLAQIALARRVLPEDVASRQKLLEASVYDVAIARMKNQIQKLDSLGLNTHGLGRNDLQEWMWSWHQNLRAKLETVINGLIAAEAKFSEPLDNQPWSPKRKYIPLCFSRVLPID
jgi:DNA-directed RNA polymerase, mitochondrial